MAKKRPQIDDIIHVVFFDHGENTEDVLRFEVIGRVIKITRRGFIVRSWGYVNDVDRAANNNSENENTYAIVKSAVDSYRILR